MYTVARELGHNNVTLLERTYGHVTPGGRRSLTVEYTAESAPQPASND